MTLLTANKKDRRWKGEPAMTRTLAILGFGAASALLAATLTARLAKPDAAASRAAFLNIYRVLTSPRCRNCHPAGDAPLQGDDSHQHAFRIRRGQDGNGLTSVRCSNCHQSANQAGEHTPPGSPDPKADNSPRWHLPSAKTRMVFERR